MSQNFISLTLTLVAQNKELYLEAVKNIKPLLQKYKVLVSSVDKLSEFVTDYFLTCKDDIYNSIKQDLGNIEIFNTDIFIQKSPRRKKKIIACDMDMTVINVETIDLIGKEILKTDKLSKLTKSAMEGEVSFKDSIINRTRMLRNIEIKKILELTNQIKINPGVISVIKTMNKFGYHTMLISGGYNIIAEAIGKKIGFKEIISNALEIKNNLITGNIESKIIDRKGKLKYLKKRVKSLNLDKKDTLAVGDGDNDIDMISFADIGIAWNAYPKVQSVADLKITSNFKTILYIQGYKEDEIE